jgi:Protein of unknown function (DUF1566)
MLKSLLSPKTTLLVILIAVWMGSGMPLASAGAKDPKPNAPVPQTGQTTCWDPAGVIAPIARIDCSTPEAMGQDGAVQAGVAWPTPRFTDRGDGTVRDNLTGLIWLKNANCFGARLWAQALTAANTLASGRCGLSDRSVPGDWRLPTIRELHSLLDFDFANPALSNAAGTGHWMEGDAFSGLDADDEFVWSSTTHTFSPNNAWIVRWSDGFTFGQNSKGSGAIVWPVRGGD